MKTIKIVALVILIIISVCITIEATAKGSAISVQKSLMGASENGGRAEVDVEVVIMIPDFPQVESLTFEEQMDVSYEIVDNSISIKAADIPMLYAALTEIPESFKPLTIAIGVDGQHLRATWSEDGGVKVEDVGLKVQIFRKKMGEISRSTKPIVDFVLKDINIVMEESDMREGHFVFRFDAVFPKVDHELFDEYLSGKPVEGLVTIDRL